MEDLPTATEAGALGVFQLKRIWASYRRIRQGHALPPSRKAEWDLDQIVFCGLNLALEETVARLSRTDVSFTDFEQWVLACNDGVLDPRQVARINAVVRGDPPTTAVRIDDDATSPDPVLTERQHAHWDEHGYVVVRQAISRDQAAAAADMVWRHRKADPSDPDTWYHAVTPGIMIPLYRHSALAANRGSSRLRRAFEEIWRRHGVDAADLWMTTDRVSFNPPEREGWRFPGPHLHWDADLRQRPLSFRTQGLLYLTDNPAHQGAFACVTGFHRRLDAWLDSLPPGVDAANSDLRAFQPTPIAGEAGDLVIWHHALPHGATPNAGTHPRIVHYVNMLPTPRRLRHGGVDEPVMARAS